MMRHRPVAQVASASGRIVGTALQVAAAIAALERFRHPRTDEEARQQAIDERRPAERRATERRAIERRAA
jgi:hypothetical protein